MASTLLALAMALQSSAIDTRSGRPDNRGCDIFDSSGTPTNVRATPNGRIVRQLSNGQYVVVVRTARDRRGREWHLIQFSDTGAPLGWVFGDLLACH
jgi:hypothetical protein